MGIGIGDRRGIGCNSDEVGDEVNWEWGKFIVKSEVWGDGIERGSRGEFEINGGEGEEGVGLDGGDVRVEGR